MNSTQSKNKPHVKSLKENKARYFKLMAVAKRELGWDDDFYRYGFLKPFGAVMKDGKYSASTMSLPQLMAAFKYMQDCGFKISHRKKSAANVKDFRAARIKKITAIWFLLYDAKIVRDKSEKAMVKYCARITKKQRMQWYTSTELNACIESLKSWATREKIKLK